MATKRDGVFVWITWLSKVMAGDQNCEWASWFKAHFENYVKAPSDFDSAKWKIEHTRKLRELRLERQKLGDRVYVEGENEIRYRSPSGAVVVGKPDLIGVTPNGPTTIYDVKTGQPKASDQVQVLLYMYLLPLTVDTYKGRTISGCVVYNDSRIPIPPEAVDRKFAADFEYFLNVLASPEAASKAPSRSECRFCDIAKTECPERVEA